MVDFATSGIHNVGNTGILNTAMNRNIFTPQALKYANMAKNFGGTALRYSGLTNPVGAAATAAYVTPQVINYLTERDPNATRSSLFNIDLTKNANERATLPSVGENAWSEMGPIPDGGVVPPIKNINTPLPSPYQDRIMNEDLMRIQQNRGNIDNRGFNFPSIFGTVRGGLEWLGEKFKRPEAKQAAYDAIMGSRDDQGWGTYKGNQYNIQDGKVYSEVNPYGKNFDSMFGSKSLEEMDEKTLSWAEDRLSKGKAISSRLRNILQNRGRLTPTNIPRPGQDNIPVGPTTVGDNVNTGRSTYTGPPTMDFNRAQAAKAGSYNQRAGPMSGGGSYGPWKADGGRVGLRLGGDPEEPAENIFNFMQDQGIPHSEQVEGEGGVLEQLIAKYIEAGFPPDQAEEMAMEEFQQMAMGSEQGIASLV